MATELQRRPITVDEYHRMAEAGIFHPDERLELLRGEIVKVAAVGNRHRGTVNRLTRLLRRFEDRAYIQVQNPVVVSEDSEPEPDLVLLEINDAAIGGRYAYPADTLAVIEVSDSSRNTDVRLKLPLYAETGVRECWIVDLIDDRILAHSDPTPTGYRTVRVGRRGEHIAFSAFPGEPLVVDEILPRLEH